MEDLSTKVLAAIKQQAIKPRPKWYFWLRSSVLWLLTALSIIFGGLAFSFIILFAYFQNLGLNHLNHPRVSSKFIWLLDSLPYAWLLIFAGLILLIYFDLKSFKKSYKYPPYLLIIASLGGSILLGVVLSGFGIHKAMNQELSRRLPFYGQVFDARRGAWGRPEAGALAGKIKSATDDAVILEDFRGQEWSVVFRDETTEDDSILIIPGQMVMMSGSLDTPGVFVAREIFPWEGCRHDCNLIKAPLKPRRSGSSTAPLPLR